MVGMRLLAVMVAVSLIAASRARPSDDYAQKDMTELTELLGAMEGYLDANEPSSRASAHDDIRIVYSSASSASEVSAAETARRGNWTSWINVDEYQSVGVGEFETCRRIMWEQDDERRCLLGCKRPLAARYSLQDQTTATWNDIENCVGPMDARSSRVSSCGFACINSNAASADKSRCNMNRCSEYGLGAGCVKCPNVRVQFFCMGRLPPANTCCPYSKACSPNRPVKPSFRSSLEVFGDSEMEKRDVIANILYEVRDALEPTMD